MAASFEPSTYKEIILFLGTAAVVVPVFHRLRLSPVLGFIGAGILLGPFGLGRLTGQVEWLRWFTIADSAEFTHLAEFGVVFLLFNIGLELSLERLRTLRRLVFGLGAAQVFVSAAAIAGVGSLLGLAPGPAVIAGVALALSSTAIVIPLIARQKRLNSPMGRASFSILLFQDLAVAPVLFTIAAVSTTADGSVVTNLIKALGQAAVALVLIIVAGRLALRPLFQLVAQTRSPELFMAACLLVIVVTAFVSSTSGLSMALGAFVAGLLLAETEYRRAIEAVVGPFQGLLLGVFFVSVGMALDVTAVLRAPMAILLASMSLVALKAAIIVALAKLFRLPRQAGLEAGLLLGAGGEFAFVLIGAATAGKLMPTDIAPALLVITTLSMISIPVLARLGRRLGRPSIQAAAIPELSPDELSGRVIVAGFGRVGQLVADMLVRHDIPYLAIDANPRLVATEREAGKPVYVGDSTSPMFLRACGLETARALVITLDQPLAIQSVVETARGARPDLTIVARARDARHARALYQLGVTDAVPETVEASLQLSEAVLVDIGVPMGPVIASIHERRDEFRRLFMKPETEVKGQAVGHRALPEFLGRRTAGRRRDD